jgi:hypothetical protein
MRQHWRVGMSDAATLAGKSARLKTPPPGGCAATLPMKGRDARA